MIPNEKLGLGTVQFGTNYGISNSLGKVPLVEVTNILDFCKQNSIRILDTASAYGNSEEVLGKNDLTSFKVISKFLPNEDKKGFEFQLKNTLLSLNLEKVYGYLAHQPEKLIDSPWDWEALNEAKVNGKIQKIGFSLNRPQELYDLLNLGMVPDLIQAPYNFLDRRFERILQELKEVKVETHTRSVFLQGLFFLDPYKLSPHFSPAIPILNRLSNISNLSGRLLGFVLSKEFIDTVIIGTESLMQLKSNLEKIYFPSDDDFPIPPSLPDSILMPMFWPLNK